MTRVPVKAWTQGVPVEDQARDQLKNVADLPVAATEARKQFQQAETARQELDSNASSAILGHATRIVDGDRATQHGPKERNHQNIADHWNAYLTGRLDVPLTALDVALMMVELKVARTKAGAGQVNRDNYVDMAGYAGCAGEIALGKAYG